MTSSALYCGSLHTSLSVQGITIMLRCFEVQPSSNLFSLAVQLLHFTLWFCNLLNNGISLDSLGSWQNKTNKRLLPGLNILPYGTNMSNTLLAESSFRFSNWFGPEEFLLTSWVCLFLFMAKNLVLQSCKEKKGILKNLQTMGGPYFSKLYLQRKRYIHVKLISRLHSEQLNSVANMILPKKQTSLPTAQRVY